MSDFFEDFFNKPKTKKKTKVLERLYEVPKKDKGDNVPHFQGTRANIAQQADILYLPEDDGYKYLLVVIDVASRLSDAEPLKTKSAEETLKAIKKIYQRGIIHQPKILQVDSGSEFKSSFSKYFANEGVKIRVAKVGRHRAQALVERRNQIIGKAILQRQTGQELITGQQSKEWVEDLPKLLTAMNKHVHKTIKKKIKDELLCEGESCRMLAIGTKVRAQLDNPKDLITGKVVGKFRSGDIRWDEKERTIKEVLLKPGYPPMYLLDGDKGESKVDPTPYTKNQLQVITSTEEYPDKSIIRGKPSTYIVEKILDKKKEKGKIYYLVKWRGFPKDEASWETRTMMMQDVPKKVAEFEEKK